MHNFVTSSNGHLENIISLSYAALLNVDAFHYTAWKIAPININTYFNGKIFNFGEAVKLTVVDTTF